MLVNLIEKYASDLDLENLFDIAGDNCAENERDKMGKLSKNQNICLSNNDYKRYNKHDKGVQTIVREKVK